MADPTETESDESRIEHAAEIVSAVAGAAVMVLAVIINFQQASGEDVGYHLGWSWEHRVLPALRRWRSQLLGTPVYTEEQIREAHRLLVIEAMRVVRSGR